MKCEGGGVSNFPVRCPTCGGRKIVRMKDTGEEVACPKCRGRGWLPESELEDEDMPQRQEHVMVSNASHQYDWRPKSDITTYELALCMPMFAIDWHQVGRIYDSLPSEAKRHWRIFPEPS